MKLLPIITTLESICFTLARRSTARAKHIVFSLSEFSQPLPKINLFLYFSLPSSFLHRHLFLAFNSSGEANPLAEMELNQLIGTRTQSNTTAHSQTQTLPPKRGQVKITIFKSIFGSVSAFASSAGGVFGGRKHREDAYGDREDGGRTPLNSPSMTPQISRGYDDNSDG